MPYLSLTEDKIPLIKDLYASGKSTVTIGKELNLGEWSVRRSLHKAGVAVRSRFAFSKKHSLNERFFESIDTEEKAYWLGFMYADGAVYSNKKGCMMHLTLADKDLGHLEAFKLALQTSAPIHRFENRKQNGLFIWSKRLHGDLIRAGCYEQKGFKIRLPSLEVVSAALRHHFIRGYFDGDGCISWQPKRSRISVKIISNVDFVADLKRFLGDSLGIEPFYDVKVEGCVHNPEDKYTSLEFSRRENILKYYAFMYHDATIFLQRKKAIFDTYLQYKNDKA